MNQFILYADTKPDFFLAIRQNQLRGVFISPQKGRNYINTKDFRLNPVHPYFW